MQNAEKDFNYYFRQDILKLFSAFNQMDTFRFSEFVAIWNEMKFFQLFALPRFFPFDYRNFMKDTLRIVAEYLYDDDLDHEVRAAALYTVYAMFNHQMNRPRIKVAVTPAQWINILQFIDLINQAEHVDVEYVFRYLVHSDAFEFSSTYEIENSIPSLKTNYKNLKHSDQENIDEGPLNMKEFAGSILADDLTKDMETIHDAYLDIKREFLNSKAHCSKITYINDDFKDLIGLKELNEKIEAPGKTVKKEVKCRESNEYEDEEEEEMTSDYGLYKELLDLDLVPEDLNESSSD